MSKEPMTIHSELIERLNNSADGLNGQYGMAERAELLREAAGELSTLASTIAGLEVEGWLGIETAPMDGHTQIDLWFPVAGRKTNWRWYKRAEFWGAADVAKYQMIDRVHREQPTHWRPPPTPPAAISRARG